MKLNTVKCHLLISGNKHEYICANVREDKIWKGCDVKLLGITRTTRETINVSTIAIIHYFSKLASYWSIYDWFQIYQNWRLQDFY